MAQKCPPESEKVDEAHKLLELSVFLLESGIMH